MSNFKFLGKLFIEADLECVTALHIGGTQEGYEIGGMDNPVIKASLERKIDGIPADCPYIPGSSLRGKMRSLLEWALDKVRPEEEKDKDGNFKGYKALVHQCDNENCEVCITFGNSADKLTKTGPTRLTVLDSFPTTPTIGEWDRDMGDGIFTEIKSENNIDRLSSNAVPRSMERVPAGSVFKAKMIYTLYKETDLDMLKNVFLAMEILEDSTLGGGGSRGSGRVRFGNFSIEFRSKSYYTDNTKPTPVTLKLNGSELKTVREIKENFNKLFEGVKTK